MSPLPRNHVAVDVTSPSDAEIRLQALNQTKDKLLSIVGHDLRTAIGGVISLVDILDHRLAAGDVDEVRRLSGLIRRSARDADDLLCDLVAWTRSHGQAIHFKLESLNIIELIEEEVRRLEVSSSRKQQTIRIEADSAGMLRADRHMLQVVFRNLLTNALKFSDHGGEVIVRLKHARGEWVFQVCDQGIGMTPEVQECLLKIDNRKEQVGTDGETGSGFGLLLCEDFVQRHGGRLSWESAPQQGSTFRFTVPELIG
jgi:signal transduction histidine kinase